MTIYFNSDNNNSNNNNSDIKTKTIKKQSSVQQSAVHWKDKILKYSDPDSSTCLVQDKGISQCWDPDGMHVKNNL